jgi:hypothetical protein
MAVGSETVGARPRPSQDGPKPQGAIRYVEIQKLAFVVMKTLLKLSEY